MINKMRIIYHLLACKKGFSVIELAIGLSVSGLFLSAVVYQGTRMMEEAFVQKVQKEIVQYAFYIKQWKSNAMFDDTWDHLSEEGLDEKNKGLWKRVLQEGIASSNNKYCIPSLGKGAYLSMIRKDHTTFFVLGGINGNKTDGPIFTESNALHIANGIKNSGMNADIKKEKNGKCWLCIPIE